MVMVITLFKVTHLNTNQKVMYNFILVINTNLPSISHRFRDIAFNRSKIALFGYGTYLVFNAK